MGKQSNEHPVITYKTPFGHHTEPVAARNDQEGRVDREYAREVRQTNQLLRQTKIMYQESKREE